MSEMDFARTMRRSEGYGGCDDDVIEIICIKQGQKYRLEAKGHATTTAETDDGEGVKVCAAVSMLTSTLALSLEMLPGIDRESVHVDAGDGYAAVSARGRGPVKTLFQSAYCGAAALHTTHPDRVNVKADQFFQKFWDSPGAFSWRL